MPDVSLSGIEFTIRGNADSASDAVSRLTQELTQLKNAMQKSEGITGLATAMKKLENINTVMLQTAGNILSDISKLDFSNIKQAATGIQDIANAASQLTGISGSGSSVSESVVGDASFATQMIGSLKEGLSAIPGVLKNIASYGAKGLGTIISYPFKQGYSSVKQYTSSLGNLLSQFKRVAMYRLIRYAIKLVTQALKDGINNLYEWSSLTNGKFKSSMDSISTSFTYFKNSLGAAVSPIIDALAPAIDWLIDKIVALLNVINQLFARLSGASSWTKAVKKTTEYSDAVSGAGGAAEEAIRYLAPFDELNRLPDDSSSGGGGSSGTDYSGMFEEVTNFSEDIANFADKLREAFENGDWQTLGTLLGEKVNEIVDNIDWEGAGQKIGYWINSWFSTKYWTLDTINFTNIGSKIATLLNNALAEIDFEIIGRSMVQKFTKFGDTIVGFIETADWGLIAKSAGDVIIGYFNEIGDWFQETDFSTLATSIWNGIKNAVTGVDWSAVATSIFRALGSALGAVTSFVAQLGKDIIEDIWDAIVNASKTWDTNGDGDLTGQEIINGIWEGIKNAIKNVGTWIKDNIFKPFIDGFRTAFKIESPSKKMETEGGFVGEGLLNGIANVFKNIASWCDTHILQPIRDAIGGFDLKSLIFGNGGESSFTIDMAINKVGDWSQDVITVLGTKTEKVKKTVQGAVEKATTWVSDAWSAVKQKTETVKKTVQSAVKKASTWVSDAWTAVKTKTGTVTRTVQSAVKKASTWVSAAWSAAQTVGGTIKKTIESAVTKGKWDETAWTVANWKKTTVSSTVTANVQQGSNWNATAYNLLTNTGNKTVSVKTNLTSPKWNNNITPTMNVKANFTSAVYSGGAVTVPGKVVAMTKASGGVYNNGSWSSIPQYASGTANAHGSLFVAGEAGAELVGHIGGRTEVLNRSQLAATMFAAVRSAIASTGFKVSGVSAARGNVSPADGMNEETLYRAMLRAMNDSDVGDRPIELDGNVLYQSMVNRNRQNTRMTGVNALA